MSIKLLGDQAQKISRHSYFEQLASGILLSTKMVESRAHRGTHFWVLLRWYYAGRLATTIFSEAHLCKGCADVSRKVSPDWSRKTMTSFFELFQYWLGSGLGTIGDFSSEQLLHDPFGMLKQYCNHSKQYRNNVATLCCAKSCCC